MDSNTTDRIRRLLAGPIDWTYLIDAADAHGVKPLLSHNLSRTCGELIPKLNLGPLRRYLRAHSLNNIFFTRELLRVLHILEENGISAIPWKGPVLAAVYGDIALRQFGDLDILVRERDSMRGKDLLVARGYRLFHQEESTGDLAAYHGLRQVYELVREDRRVVVELHWAITSHTFYFPLDPASLWEQAETVSLAGSPVRNLGPEDLLLVLCVHGAKHHWGKLMWICDIAELLRVYSEKLNWGRLLNRTRSLGGLRMLFLGLILARDLLGAKIPADVQRHMCGDPTLAFLAAEVRSGLFSGGSRMAVERPCFYIGLRERAMDRMRCRLYLGYRMLAPSAQTCTLRVLHGGRSVLRFLYGHCRDVNSFVLTLAWCFNS